jgi:hypothetical protein
MEIEMKRTKPGLFLVPPLAAVVLFFSALAVASGTAAQLDRDVDNAIQKLYAGSATAKELSKIA